MYVGMEGTVQILRVRGVSDWTFRHSQDTLRILIAIIYLLYWFLSPGITHIGPFNLAIRWFISLNAPCMLPGDHTGKMTPQHRCSKEGGGGCRRLAKGRPSMTALPVTSGSHLANVCVQLKKEFKCLPDNRQHGPLVAAIRNSIFYTEHITNILNVHPLETTGKATT